MKRRVFERYILIQYFKPQLVTGGLVFLQWVNKLQSWDRLELSNNIKYIAQVKTEGELQRKILNEKKRTRKGDIYSIFIQQLVTGGLVIMEWVNNLQNWDHLGISSIMK